MNCLRNRVDSFDPTHALIQFTTNGHDTWIVFYYYTNTMLFLEKRTLKQSFWTLQHLPKVMVGKLFVCSTEWTHLCDANSYASTMVFLLVYTVYMFLKVYIYSLWVLLKQLLRKRPKIDRKGTSSQQHMEKTPQTAHTRYVDQIRNVTQDCCNRVLLMVA